MNLTRHFVKHMNCLSPFPSRKSSLSVLVREDFLFSNPSTWLTFSLLSSYIGLCTVLNSFKFMLWFLQ